VLSVPVSHIDSAVASRVVGTNGIFRQPENKSATSNQAAVLFSQNKPAPAISHQPTEQAAGVNGSHLAGLKIVLRRLVDDESAVGDGLGRWAKKIFGAPSIQRDVDLAIRSEGGGEQVAVEMSILRVVTEEVAGANCHHAARRARDHPYLARQLSDGEIWTAHRGVNPCGLFVRPGIKS
jgi:hypothetical protein